MAVVSGRFTVIGGRQPVAKPVVATSFLDQHRAAGTEMGMEPVMGRIQAPAVR
jgi:hypothetical protein